MTSSRRAGGTATVLVLLGGVAVGASGCETFSGPGSSSSGAGGMSGSSSSEGTTMSSMSTMTTSTTSSMSTMSTTIASSSSGMPDPCDVGDGDAIPEMCGVFVKEGAANGVGTQASPFGSIMAALDVAGPAGKPVYVCQGAFDEAVVIQEGNTILGGVDCTNGWHWVAAPSGPQRTLVAPAAGVPLIVASEPTAGIIGRVFGFTFHAAAGAAPGDSSIAAIVQGAPVVFERTRFEAGAGHDGTDGVQNAPAAVMGTAGNNGAGNTAASCSPPQSGTYPGGFSVLNASCAGSAAGNGGAGGDGNDSAAMFGADGALDPAQPTKGGGGHGQLTNCMGFPASWCLACAPGEDGIVGGNGGVGSAGVGMGAVDDTTFVGVSGGAGQPGGPGGGGGGGGGARTANGCRGDSGGGGGAGGCGGAGGPGGTYGGSSIGLVVEGTANVTFVACSASSVQAGRGGNGAPGLAGAGGGLGGKGGDHNILASYVTNACSGGAGGTGGNGGHGGGGSGGHSVGLLCSNTTCDATGLTFDPVMPTFAGVGGIGDGTNDGSPGQAVETLTL